MLTKDLQTQGANLKRWLGLLLVLFIFYGTTVEAAHKHGRVAPPSSHATSFSNLDSSSGTFSTKPGCNDCLICQLHQNVSATLISVKLNTTSLIRLTPSSSLVPVSFSSTLLRPQSGRAPPQAN